MTHAVHLVAYALFGKNDSSGVALSGPDFEAPDQRDVIDYGPELGTDDEYGPWLFLFSSLVTDKFEFQRWPRRENGKAKDEVQIFFNKHFFPVNLKSH